MEDDALREQDETTAVGAATKARRDAQRQPWSDAEYLALLKGIVLFCKSLQSTLLPHSFRNMWFEHIGPFIEWPDSNQPRTIEACRSKYQFLKSVFSGGMSVTGWQIGMNIVSFVVDNDVFVMTETCKSEQRLREGYQYSAMELDDESMSKIPVPESLKKSVSAGPFIPWTEPQSLALLKAIVTFCEKFMPHPIAPYKFTTYWMVHVLPLIQWPDLRTKTVEQCKARYQSIKSAATSGSIHRRILKFMMENGWFSDSDTPATTRSVDTTTTTATMPHRLTVANDTKKTPSSLTPHYVTVANDSKTSSSFALRVPPTANLFRHADWIRGHRQEGAAAVIKSLLAVESELKQAQEKVLQISAEVKTREDALNSLKGTLNALPELQAIYDRRLEEDLTSKSLLKELHLSIDDLVAKRHCMWVTLEVVHGETTCPASNHDLQRLPFLSSLEGTSNASLLIGIIDTPNHIEATTVRATTNEEEEPISQTKVQEVGTAVVNGGGDFYRYVMYFDDACSRNVLYASPKPNNTHPKTPNYVSLDDFEAAVRANLEIPARSIEQIRRVGPVMFELLLRYWTGINRPALISRVREVLVPIGSSNIATILPNTHVDVTKHSNIVAPISNMMMEVDTGEDASIERQQLTKRSRFDRNPSVDEEDAAMFPRVAKVPKLIEIEDATPLLPQPQLQPSRNVVAASPSPSTSSSSTSMEAECYQFELYVVPTSNPDVIVARSVIPTIRPSRSPLTTTVKTLPPALFDELIRTKFPPGFIKSTKPYGKRTKNPCFVFEITVTQLATNSGGRRSLIAQVGSSLQVSHYPDNSSSSE